MLSPDDRKPILVVGIKRPAESARDFGIKDLPDGTRKVPGSVRRLESVLGLRQGCLLRAVDAVNLLGPHDEVTYPRLRAAAETLRLDVEGRELLILCGKPVHYGFRHHDSKRLWDGGVTVTVEGVVTALLPHPSGRNRDWNDAAKTEACRAALSALTAGLIPENLLESSAQVQAARVAVTQTRSRMDRVLDGIRSVGVLRTAARSAGISESTLLAWRRRDPEFARACGVAVEEFLDRCEAEIARRGLHGVKREVRYQGQVVGEETTYSDVLLLRLLAAKRREWAERRHATLSDPAGGPVTIRSLLEAATADEED